MLHRYSAFLETFFMSDAIKHLRVYEDLYKWVFFRVSGWWRCHTYIPPCTVTQKSINITKEPNTIGLERQNSLLGNGRTLSHES